MGLYPFLKEKEMLRLPVVYKGKPLMPMKASRVKKFIKLGKARIRYDRKLNIHYLQLLIDPSDTITQQITIGIDPGSTFDGISVVSEKCHHVNIELIQRTKKGKNAISSFKKRQAVNRRVRRSRLRHRRIRFDNRTSKKLSPTIKANIDYRKWLIVKLLKIYPISTIVVEDVRFNHFKSTKGKSFSHVENGKNELYKFIKDLGLTLELYDGFNTKKLRVNSFGTDPKSKDKGSKGFTAHCIDSFVLACNKENKIDSETGEILDQPIITNQLDVMKKVIFIEKIVKVRRCLTRLRKNYKEAKNYYRQSTGGVKEVYQNFSGKSNIVRVKPNGEQSNHPLKWGYINNGKVERFKCTTAPYGGTTINGKSFFNGTEWNNRVVSYG